MRFREKPQTQFGFGGYREFTLKDNLSTNTQGNMQTQDQTSPAVLASLKSVQDRLDEMKKEGLGLQEQLKAISHDTGIIPDGVISNSVGDIDIETTRRLNRLAHLEDISTALRSLQVMWETTMKAEVREAGIKLFGYLANIVKVVVEGEKAAEMEALSQLWGYDPDLTSLYPWLTKGVKWDRQVIDNPYPSRTKTKEEALAEAKAIQMRAKVYSTQEDYDLSMSVSPSGVTAEPVEVVKVGVPRCPVTADQMDLFPTQDVKQGHSALPEYLVARGFKIRQSEQDLSLATNREGTVVSKLNRPVLPEPRETAESHPDHIRREKWTAALQEEANDWHDGLQGEGIEVPWYFAESAEGMRTSIGTSKETLRWAAGDHGKARLDISVNDKGTVFIVHLILWYQDCWRRQYKLMTLDELEGLHLDPGPFIVQTLLRPPDKADDLELHQVLSQSLRD